MGSIERALLVVPGLFGSKIHDPDSGPIWGSFKCLYRGAPLATLAGLRGTCGPVMTQIQIAPGVAYDIFGALIRALTGAGYRPDETLHLYAFDWRLRVVELGAALAAEVRRLAERTGGPVDLLGLSNGGPVIRAAFAADRSLPVERVVTSGSPHGGAIETLSCLDRGFQFAPLGRTVTPEEFIACPGALDALPAPGTPVFLDPAYDLYDLDTWLRLRLAVFRRHPDDPTWIDVMRVRLRDAQETWRTLQSAAAPRRLVCVCGTGLPTQIRVPVRDGRALAPGEGRLSQLPAEALGSGDGALTIESASGWTGADAQVITIPVQRHRDTVRTKAAFDAILRGLA